MAVYDMTDFVSEHAGKFFVIGGKFDELIGDDDDAGRESKGVCTNVPPGAELETKTMFALRIPNNRFKPLQNRALRLLG